MAEQEPKDRDEEHGVSEDEYEREVLGDESPAMEDAEVTGSEGPAAEAPVEGEAPSAEDEAALEQTARELAEERLQDLQRLTAEYKNFRRRTEENREVERERAIGEAGKQLFPVLDDLERAEKHGDLVEGSAFATIAGKIRQVAHNLGIERFGEQGEPFDPNQHQAVLQQPSADVEQAVIGDVVAPGYRLGSTLLRAAQVVVLTPQE